MPQNYSQRVHEWGSVSFSTGQEALSTTAEEVLESDARRRAVTIRNLDESITVYVGEDDTVGPTTGFPLAAGESVRITTTAAIWMEAGSGTPTVAYIVESD